MFQLENISDLYEPLPLPPIPQSQLLSHLCCGGGVGHVLLVVEDEQGGVPQPVVVQHAVQLLLRLGKPAPVLAVHHEDDGVTVLEVVLPQRPDLGLAAHVPDGEVDVLVLHALHVEADGGDGGDHLAQLELVQHGRLAGVVQPQHDDPGRAGRGEPVDQSRDKDPHVVGLLCLDSKRENTLLIWHLEFSSFLL